MGPAKMNRYRTAFVAICPANGIAVTYRLRLETPDMVRVEAIQAAIAAVGGRGFHEDIADALHKALGGRQILKAHHHGVDIRTSRGG